MKEQKEQKVIITESAREVNDFLDKGWTVVSITAQHVSITGGYDTKEFGKFCFVLERP